MYIWSRFPDRCSCSRGPVILVPSLAIGGMYSGLSTNGIEVKLKSLSSISPKRGNKSMINKSISIIQSEEYTVSEALIQLFL